MQSNTIVVYTDGACQNGPNGNKLAGAGVWFADDDKRNISCPVPGRQTNQRAEAWAVFEAIRTTDKMPSQLIHIISDSLYAIKCSDRSWVAKSNLDIFNKIWNAMEGRKVAFEHVRGHTGVAGNEAADHLAVAAVHQQKMEQG